MRRMKFTLHKGKRPKSCWACLSRWASNDMVVRQMADVGFTEVEVTGDGRKREANALWPLEDATADTPRQIKRIVEIAERDGEPQIST